MVTGADLGLQVTLFPLLFIRIEKATGMNDTERWAQSQTYDRRASSKNKILSLTAGGRNPAAAINPEEQDQALHYFLWFSHRMGVHGWCRSRRPKDESAGPFNLYNRHSLFWYSHLPAQMIQFLSWMVFEALSAWSARPETIAPFPAVSLLQWSLQLTVDCPKFPQNSDVSCCCF